MQTRPIRFYFRGETVSIDGVPPTLSVLDWLREHARLAGTKEGCAEGDCGACTVVIGELAAHAEATGTAAARASVVGGLALRTVNACIQFLPTLDGKALFTVEDLKRIAGGVLHPVQQALADCHGSQCGFCTPGFAMSLFGAYEHHCEAGTRPARAELADELAGNLCRCTGYRPILDAGERMFEAAPVRLDTAPVVAALAALRSDETFVYAGPNPAVRADGAPRIDHFFAPRAVEEFARLREELPAARLLAGATDVGLWVNKQFRDLGDLLYIGRVDALRRIESSETGLLIGAAATLEDAWAALAGMQPSLREIGLRFASPPVRHAGTLGGNVANGSPIGDGPPVLIALGASLVLRLGERRRTLLLEDFYLDYMKNRLAPGEFVEAIVVPRPPARAAVRAYKLSKRYDSDISAVCAGLVLELEGAGAQTVVRGARFAFGGMAAIVKRARKAEAAVLGQPWTEATVRAAMAALGDDYAPLSDMRASADYRLRAARNLLLRLWLETRGEAPLLPAMTSVWQALQSGRTAEAAR